MMNDEPDHDIEIDFLQWEYEVLLPITQAMIESPPVTLRETEALIGFWTDEPFDRQA
jgi:hypothetical protein